MKNYASLLMQNTILSFLCDKTHETYLVRTSEYDTLSQQVCSSISQNIYQNLSKFFFKFHKLIKTDNAFLTIQIRFQIHYHIHFA